MANLYVMQNDYGLIKIGRSHDVERRRKALEITDACRIALVAIIPGAGHLEEQTHIDLEEFRLIGEWFTGNAAARTAIEQKFGSGVISGWPFDLAPKDAVATWLEDVEGRRLVQRVNRDFSRLISHMKAVPAERQHDPGGCFDTHIWTVLSSIGPNRTARIFAYRGPDGNSVLHVAGGSDSGTLVPKYTTDVAAALSIWPDDLRPTAWADDAWACCIAGLAARKASYSLITQALLDSEDTDS